MKHLDDILLIAVFVVLPLLQRIFAHLQQKRSEAAQRERARRALEDPTVAEPAESEARGRERWRELLTQPGEMEEVAEEELFEPEPRTEVRPAPPPPPPPAPAKRAAPATLVPFEPKALGGLAPAPSEDELEGAASVARSPLVALETLDVHEKLEPLADLPGLVPAPAAEARAPARASGLAGAGAGGWRRAVVLSEILQPPVALRGPGGHAPGLGEVA